MADNLIPQGAVIGNGNQNTSGSAGNAIPEGAVIGTAPTSNEPTQPQSGGMWDKIKQVGADELQSGKEALEGIGSGALNLVHGIGEMGEKMATGESMLSPGSYIARKIGEKVAPEVTTQAVQGVKQGAESALSPIQQASQIKNPTLMNKVGYGGETLLEFIMGDEALKGMSIAEKTMQAAKTMKILENSPKLMNALKAGALMGDSAEVMASLAPEERALIRQYPVIGRLVKVGMDSIRQGAVQGLQTEAHTGGDTGQAVEDASKMAGVSAAIGVPLEGVSAGLEGMAKGSKTATELSQAAQAAPDKEELAQRAQGLVSAAREKMHDDFERGIQDIKGKLGQDEIHAPTAPIADKAKEILNNIKADEAEEHQFTEQMRKSIPENLDPSTRGILQRYADGTVPLKKPVYPRTDEQYLQEAVENFNKRRGTNMTFKDMLPEEQQIVESDMNKIKDSEAIKEEPAYYNVNDLIAQRQFLRKKINTYDLGSPNARALRQLYEGIDDTIQQLAESSGSPEVGQQYSQLRGVYKTKVNALNNPVLKKLESGEYDDAAKLVVNGQKTALSAEDLESVLGTDGMTQFGHDVFGNMLKDATNEKGRLNPAKLITNWSKIPEQTREKLFKLDTTGQDLSELMKDAKTAANVQHLMRAGVVSGLGAAGGMGFGHTIAGTLIGLVLGEGGVAGTNKARDMIDYIANNPKVWKVFAEGPNALAKSAIVKPVVPAIKKAIANTDKQDNGVGVMRNIMSGANPMAGNEGASSPKEFP